MKAQALAATLQLEPYEIASEMKKRGLSADFITAADGKERDEIVADIQDMIDDCAKQEKEEGAYIRFNDLEAVAKDIRAFKDSLLEEVDKAGGVKHLSELTGIPQPFLYRN